MQQALVPINDRASWETCLKEIPHSPAHLWSYNHAIMQSSHLSTYLYYAKSAGFKAVCALAVRKKNDKKDIFTPYGFGGMITNGHHAHFKDHWKQFLTNAGFICGYIALHPTLGQQIDLDPSEVYAGNPIYILDLTLPIDDLFKNLSKTHRYELRQWEKEEKILILDKRTLKSILPDLYRQTLSRVDAASHYYFTDETLQAILQVDPAIAMGIKVNDAIEAISVFLYTPYIADYFLFASTQEGRKHARGLIWENIKILKQLNVPALNLGGGIRIGDQLENFKRRFGGREYIYQAAKQVYDSVIFNELCQQANSLPMRTNYFPPYYFTNN